MLSTCVLTEGVAETRNMKLRVHYLDFDLYIMPSRPSFSASFIQHIYREKFIRRCHKDFESIVSTMYGFEFCRHIWAGTSRTLDISLEK